MADRGASSKSPMASSRGGTAPSPNPVHDYSLAGSNRSSLLRSENVGYVHSSLKQRNGTFAKPIRREGSSSPSISKGSGSSPKYFNQMIPASPSPYLNDWATASAPTQPPRRRKSRNSGSSLQSAFTSSKKDKGHVKKTQPSWTTVYKPRRKGSLKSENGGFIPFLRPFFG